MTRYLTLEWIVAYHEVLMYEQGQLPHLIAPDKLEAALARPQASAFGEDAFATLAEKAAALLQAVVIAHPFLDGNKRAGLGARPGCAFFICKTVEDSHLRHQGNVTAERLSGPARGRTLTPGPSPGSCVTGEEEFRPRV